MKTLILPVEQCRRNMAAIQAMLEITCEQDPNALIDHLNECATLLATSAQAQASLKHHVSTAQLIAVQEANKEGYKPNMAKVFIDGRCAEILAEYELCVKQNSALVHKCDALRSILSYTKAERYASNMQGG